MTATLRYTGNFQTLCTHLASGQTVPTDPPVDNLGKGEAFSPTDLLATSLAACMLTILAQAAHVRQWEIGFPTADVQKIMAKEGPRRVAEILVSFHFFVPLDLPQREIVERAALSCPVAKSLHPDIKQTIEFHWNE